MSIPAIQAKLTQAAFPLPSPQANGPELFIQMRFPLKFKTNCGSI